MKNNPTAPSGHVGSSDLLGVREERLLCPVCDGRGVNTNNGSDCPSCDCGIVDSPREAIADIELTAELDEPFYLPGSRGNKPHARFFA